jgi:hypothetical protein
MKDYQNFTTFTCHHEPTYLLARHCNDDYYGYKGLCCKIDSMFNFLMNEPDNNAFFQNIKYVFQADDDLFIRVDQFLKWVSMIDKSGIGHLPIVGNNEPSINFVNRWQGIWHINGCKEITSTGWYHPFFINKPAMERLKLASASWGFMDTCRNFDVSQDVGGDIYFWLFGFYHIMIPGMLLISVMFYLLHFFIVFFSSVLSFDAMLSFFLIFSPVVPVFCCCCILSEGVNINAQHKGQEIFAPDQMMMHCIKQDHDHCGEGHEKEWPDALRYSQKMIVGCGDVDHHGPFHHAKNQAGQYDAWEYYRDHGKELELGIPGKYEWFTVNATVGLHSKNDTAAVIIKDIVPLQTPIENGMYNNEKVVEKVIPWLRYIEGYATTKHSRENDIIHKEWKPFTLNDCNPPGSVRPPK